MNKADLERLLHREYGRRIGWMKWQIRTLYACMSVLAGWCILYR